MSDQPNAPDPTTPPSGATPDPAGEPPRSTPPGAPPPTAASPGTPSIPPSAPPSASSSASSPGASAGASPWPDSAKATTAVLAVIAIGALILAIVGFSQASNESDDRSDVEAGLGDAQARAAAAEAERDELADERDELVDQLEESESTIESLAAERDEAVAANEQLNSDLAAETERADAAEAQLAEIGESYPIAVDSTLDPELVVGTYALALTQVFCEGNAPCGSLPGASQATVSDSGSGNLALTIDGLIDAGLANFGGSLYAVGTSSTAFPACPAGDRNAHVSVTMWANDMVLAEDGTRTVVDIGGSISIAAPASGEDCAFGLTLYSATFSPVG